MPAVAITDTANLFGALEFSQACAAKGIQPIIGCQIALTPCRQSAPAARSDRAAGAGRDRARQSAAAVLGGVPRTRDPGLKPQLALDAIAAHAAGLILLTGGANGPLARLLAEGQKPEAERLLARLAEAFPDRVAMELQRHGHGQRACAGARSDRAGGCGRHPSGRHQRLLLRHARHVRGARRAAGDRRGPAAVGARSQARHAGALVQAGRRHAHAVRRPAGGLRQHAGHRAALRGDDGDAQAAAAGLAQGARGQHRGGDRARHGDRGTRSPHGCDGRRCRRRARAIANGSTTSCPSSSRWASPATS